MNRKNISPVVNTIQNEELINNIIDHQEKVKRIYHYTSMDVFFKMIDNIKKDFFTFRAGSVYTMNDSQEMILGYNSLIKSLPRIEEKLNVNECERILNLLQNSKNNEIIKKQFGVWQINDDITNFVVSFSTAKDILPMWYLYGGNGTGVCLEFSPYEIKKYYKKNHIDRDFAIEKCVYNNKEVEDFLDEYATILYKKFIKQYDPEERKRPMVKAKYLATMSGIICAYIKHKGFEYEKEVRMNVFRHKSDWKFGESRNGNRITYVEVPIPITALTNIFIGPVADMKMVRNSMILSMRSKGIQIYPIQSKIPFRQY